MKQVLLNVTELMRGDGASDRVVPPTGFTARLTLLSAAAMTFLAVFALALSLAAGRLADRWSDDLARSATLQISAPAEDLPALTETALNVLNTTAGVAEARALSQEEEAALLAPWFGEGVALEDLPVPQLIAITEEGDGYDGEALRLRLEGEVPGAVLDDHGRWRRPLLQAANRMRVMGWLSLLLITGVTGAIVSLAAHSALAANAQVIEVLRLVGATDEFIASAFVRRYTLRAFWGAALGMVLGMVAIWLLPEAQPEGGFLTGLGFRGWGWIWPFFLPLVAAIVAFWATRSAARRILEELS